MLINEAQTQQGIQNDSVWIGLDTLNPTVCKTRPAKLHSLCQKEVDNR